MAFTDYAMIQEQQRKIELLSSPVVLRLRHVGKSYAMAKSADRVVALKDMHLCEDDEAPPDSTSGDRISSCINSANMAMVDENGKAALPSFGPIRRGEFVMIRGPSGGGKATLLNIIGAIDSCTEGSVELNGDTINAKTSASHLSGIRLRTLGFVFQTFNLIATMTAAENVELPMTLMGNRSHAEIQIRARQLLALVGLRNRVNHLPSELSGGEQQRVTIARSLSNNPAVLLLDEPTGDLDTANTIDVMNLLVRLNRCTKTTCIMVTHNPDIECYADRILYVSDGRFVREVHNDRPSQLDPKLYSKYLDQRDDITTMTTNLANHTGEGGKVKQTQGSTAVVAATVPREEQQQSFSVSV